MSGWVGGRVSEWVAVCEDAGVDGWTDGGQKSELDCKCVWECG